MEQPITQRKSSCGLLRAFRTCSHATHHNRIGPCNQGGIMELAEVAPFNKLLGLKVHQRSPERSEAELTVREELCNRRGVLHGGPVMALGDTPGGISEQQSSRRRPYRHHREQDEFFCSCPLGRHSERGMHSIASRPNDCGSGDPDHARRWKACGYCHPDAAALRAKRIMAQADITFACAQLNCAASQVASAQFRGAGKSV